jgi:hypothetical protein
MRREDVLQVLREHRPELDQFGVASLALFGSVARDEAQSDSDVDLLVEFDQPVGLFKFIGLQIYLQQLLGRRVDLVTPEALRAPMRERILGEALRAA